MTKSDNSGANFSSNRSNLPVVATLMGVLVMMAAFQKAAFPAWALAMPLVLLAGQDLARLLREYRPPDRELPASYSGFTPLFGALLFHGLAIGTVFVAHAQMARGHGGAGECTGCGSGASGGGCGSGCCGEAAKPAAAKAGGGCGCGSAPAAAKPAGGGCGCGSGAAGGTAGQQRTGAPAALPPQPRQMQGPMMPPNRVLNLMVGGKASEAAAQKPVAGDAKANGNPGPGMRALPLPPGIKPTEPKAEVKEPASSALPGPKAIPAPPLKTEPELSPTAPVPSAPAPPVPSNPVPPQPAPPVAGGEKKSS